MMEENQENEKIVEIEVENTSKSDLGRELPPPSYQELENAGHFNKF